MKKKQVVFLSIFLITIGIFFLFERKTEIKETKNNKNIELAIYINEEETNTIPSKDSGYYYDRKKSSCTNGAYINWDSISWSPVVNNMNEYKTRCELHFTTTYTEGILNGTDPVLKDELVPVTIEDNGTVKKADLENEWYSYANKEWANAVILEDQYDSLNTKGKVHGATKEDGYVSFDGVDDYIDLGLENYDFGNEITIATKFSITSINATGNVILENAEQAGVGIYISAEEPKFELAVNVDGTYYRGLSQTEVVLDKDYMIIAVYDGQEIKLYVDGNLETIIPITGNIKVSTVPFYLGANPNNDVPSEFGNLNIKQSIIINRAINSEEELAALNVGQVVNNEGLLRYVDFTNKSYEDNEIIPEEKIESYFVWIPKYRYQLWDLGQYDSLTTIDESKAHEIPVIFGDYTTLDEREGECTTPMESGETGNCEVGDYMTHPAFISIPSTGFWVGKFETGYNGATSTSEAEQNINDSSKIIVKPNTYSWGNIQISNAHLNAYNYQRNLESHMMKNTEWGAVAYLQHSTYGSAVSVRINNNTLCVTGYAANNEPTCGYTGTNIECNISCDDETCNTAYPNSILASTTGNISGIYDMSGGAHEYVMTTLTTSNGELISGYSNSINSGFNGICIDGSSVVNGVEFPDKKYYDIYQYSDKDSYFFYRILGDAIGEMGPFYDHTYPDSDFFRVSSSWYNDIAHTSHITAQFISRGAANVDGNAAGIFGFYPWNGSELYANLSFRLILTPTGGVS